MDFKPFSARTGAVLRVFLRGMLSVAYEEDEGFRVGMGLTVETAMVTKTTKMR
jgi:hypothetical protein